MSGKGGKSNNAQRNRPGAERSLHVNTLSHSTTTPPFVISTDPPRALSVGTVTYRAYRDVCPAKKDGGKQKTAQKKKRPQISQPKFPNQICDSHPDSIEQTTNVHFIPPLTVNTDTRKETRSTEIQTNPFPPPSLTHPLLPRKHTPHLTSETPPLSVP